MVCFVKNIKKLEEFLNEFSRKPEIICISETRTNDKNIHSVALPGYSFDSNNSSTKAVELASMLLTLSIVKKLQTCV